MSQDNKPLTITILPPRLFAFPDFKEIFSNRELITYLALREIRVKYQQTILGALWVALPQIFNLVFYTVIFGMVARLPSEGVPYALYVFTGQAAWAVFFKAGNGASVSLMAGSGMTSKVYFPRLTITIASILASLVDSLVSLSLLSILMLWFKVLPDWRIVFLPIFIIFALVTAAAVGLWLSALAIRYRDVVQLMPWFFSFLMYASPMVYSPEILPSGLFSTIYWLNPVAIVLQGFRWCLLSTAPPPLAQGLVSAAVVVLVLISGVVYFTNVEKTFVDLL
jgi:lipopolysaccharide transport system permease protein